MTIAIEAPSWTVKWNNEWPEHTPFLETRTILDIDVNFICIPSRPPYQFLGTVGIINTYHFNMLHLADFLPSFDRLLFYKIHP